MPHFDTQTPPEQRTKPLNFRIVLLANRLRGWLMANRRRIVWISGGIFFYGVMAISVGLLILFYNFGRYIYSYEPYTDPHERTVVCDQDSFLAGGCEDPYYKTVTVVVCEIDPLTGDIVHRTCEPRYE